MDKEKENATDSPFGLLLSDDLMFTSRVTGTGRDLGITIKTARSSAILQEQARQQSIHCVILDLANPGLNLGELVQYLRTNCQPMPFLVAYGSHVDTATLQAARDAGCDVVLPRSKFVQDLPEKLPEWFGQKKLES